MTNLERCLGWLIKDLASDNLTPREESELCLMDENITTLIGSVVDDCCTDGNEHEDVRILNKRIAEEFPLIFRRIIIYYYS